MTVDHMHTDMFTCMRACPHMSADKSADEDACPLSVACLSVDEDALVLVASQHRGTGKGDMC